MRAVRFALILALGALVAACVRGLIVKVSGPLSAPVFSTSRASPLASGTLCLDRVTVEEVSPAGGGRTVWDVSSADLACPPIRRVAYGQAPEGFRTFIAAEPLKMGVAYVVHAHGQGWSGNRSFRFDTPDRAVMPDRD